MDGERMVGTGIQRSRPFGASLSGAGFFPSTISPESEGLEDDSFPFDMVPFWGTYVHFQGGISTNFHCWLPSTSPQLPPVKHPDLPNCWMHSHHPARYPW